MPVYNPSFGTSPMLQSIIICAARSIGDQKRAQELSSCSRNRKPVAVITQFDLGLETPGPPGPGVTDGLERVTCTVPARSDSQSDSYTQARQFSPHISTIMTSYLQ